MCSHSTRTSQSHKEGLVTEALSELDQHATVKKPSFPEINGRGLQALLGKIPKMVVKLTLFLFNSGIVDYYYHCWI